MHNLNLSFRFADMVVDKKRTVNELADFRALSDSRTHVRESREQLDVIDKRTAETRSSFHITLSYVFDDSGEIA